MRLSAVTNLTLVISVALIACSNTEGTPGQTASSGSPSTTSTEEGEPSSGKGGSGATKTAAKTTSGGKTTAASKAKGGTSSTTDGEDDPQQEGGSGGETTATKASSSSAKTGGAGGTSGSKPGSSTKGGSTGSGSSKTATGGTGARTTANTTARGGTSATTTTAATTQAQQGDVTVQRLTKSTPGKTTRYWDCCKPSCGWSANAQAGGRSSPATACGQDGVTLLDSGAKNKCWDNGPAFQCYWGAPWQVGPNVSYGFAAFNGPNCGKCYQLDFNDGKTMIVQAINIGTISENQFDLLIPGGGVGAAKDVACKAQWNDANLGAENGGFRATCGNDANCLKNMCQAAFGSSKQMMDACTWYTGWFNSGDNPSMVYAEVQCPAEITSRSGLR